MLEAGHATNALPQRARANVNCRIFPGVPIETVHTRLEELVADPAVTVTTLEANGPIATPPPLTYPTVRFPLRYPARVRKLPQTECHPCRGKNQRYRVATAAGIE
jgi:hypothetical protein